MKIFIATEVSSRPDMSAVQSPRAGKRKLGSESNDADYGRVIDQLAQQVAQKKEKIRQLKRAISLLQHLREVVDSPQRNLPSPKIPTPGTNSEPAPTNISGGKGKNLFPSFINGNGSNDHFENKRRRRNGASRTMVKLGDGE